MARAASAIESNGRRNRPFTDALRGIVVQLSNINVSIVRSKLTIGLGSTILTIETLQIITRGVAHVISIMTQLDKDM